MPEGYTSIVGSIKKILFNNPESGFIIGTFIPENSLKSITVKGIVFNTYENEKLNLKGTWENHKIYGRQFAISEFMTVEPKSKDGMVRYLSSKAFKGIGEKTAKRIVDKFGENTFKIIDNSPELLSQVSGVGKKQKKSILSSWDDQKGLREVMTFLRGVGISYSYAQLIFAKNGLNSVPIIKNNPYELTKISGIGFITADMIARKLGFENNSPFRASAGILYTLEQQLNNGHTCYPRNELIEIASKELNIDNKMLKNSVQQLLNDRILKLYEIENFNGLKQEFISITRLYEAEKRVAKNIFRILRSKAFTVFDSETTLIDIQELNSGLKLDRFQREAVEASLKNKVLIITGGPGTGKTTIVKFILSLMGSRIPSIGIAAPTGRAAKRISETTGKLSYTIHRLLEATNIGFQRDNENQLDQELFILDETSMIDTILMDRFLEAVPSASRLILVGDVDQLPSVGAGALLSDLIDSELIPVVRLDHIFRQAKDSFITVNAHKVRRGELLGLTNKNYSSEVEKELLDFYFIEESNPEKIVEKILLLNFQRIPERFKLDPLSDVQVLTPMHRGVTGSLNLNKKIQEKINFKSKGIEYRGIIYRVGDKVMQQQNDYDKRVFNGDLGHIVRYDEDTNEIFVRFDNSIVSYDYKELDQLSLAYAITVHKSQGSEYSAVILPITSHHFVMLQRNLLYTAITRGKKLVVLIGTETAVKMAVKNEGTLRRYTGLRNQLSASL